MFTVTIVYASNRYSLPNCLAQKDWNFLAHDAMLMQLLDASDSLESEVFLSAMMCFILCGAYQLGWLHHNFKRNWADESTWNFKQNSHLYF